MNETFQYQTAADQASLSRYLAALAEGVAAGALALADGQMSFTIRPRGLTDLAIKVRRNQGRTKVSLEMSWSEEPAAGSAAPGPENRT